MMKNLQQQLFERCVTACLGLSCPAAWKGKWEPRPELQTALHMASLPGFLPLQLARAICWGIDQLLSSHVITALKREMGCKMCALFSHMEENHACVYPLVGKKPHRILMGTSTHLN